MGLIQHCDRQGNRITEEEHHQLWLNFEYRVVAQSHVGQLGLGPHRGVFWISTIWLGYALDDGLPPSPFETTAFNNLTGDSVAYPWRTLDMATFAHKQLVRRYRGKWRKTPGKHLIVPIEGGRYFRRVGDGL